MATSCNAHVVRTGPPAYEGWIKYRDFFIAGKLVCCAVAAMAPQQWWKGIASALARLHVRLRHSKATHIAQTCHRNLSIDPARLELAAIAAEYEENIEAIREIMPGGWHPRIVLHGMEGLEEARRRGRGIVLWVSPFAHSDLVTKRALALAGYRATHLSHFGHPFSSTRLGSMLLNPIRLQAENRYLERRVLVAYGNARPAIEILKDVLRENGVVTVTAIGAGRRALSMPLLDGTLRLAMGAPSLALDTGAALIPVHTVPDGDSTYAVHFGPDLNAGASPGSGEVLQAIAESYVTLLESFIRAHPADWHGWFSVGWEPASSPTTAA